MSNSKNDTMSNITPVPIVLLKNNLSTTRSYNLPLYIYILKKSAGNLNIYGRRDLQFFNVLSTFFMPYWKLKKEVFSKEVNFVIDSKVISTYSRI